MGHQLIPQARRQSSLVGQHAAAIAEGIGLEALLSRGPGQGEGEIIIQASTGHLPQQLVVPAPADEQGSLRHPVPLLARLEQCLAGEGDGGAVVTAVLRRQRPALQPYQSPMKGAGGVDPPRQRLDPAQPLPLGLNIVFQLGELAEQGFLGRIAPKGIEGGCQQQTEQPGRDGVCAYDGPPVAFR